MAWTEQCKLAFKTNANALIHNNKGKGITKILKQLAKESDIPFKTLERWFYDKNSPKNEGRDLNIEYDYENNMENPAESDEPPVCPICNKNLCGVSVVRKDGTITYRDKCNTCRDKLVPRRLKRSKNNVKCPACGSIFTMTKNDITEETNE